LVVMVGSDTFGDPLNQKVLQNWPSSLIISVSNICQNDDLRSTMS
jgi:hypothetical protein